MKKFWPLALIAVGALLILGNAVYAVWFVGIPGPDDAADQLARQETQGSLAVWWIRSNRSA